VKQGHLHDAGLVNTQGRLEPGHVNTQGPHESGRLNTLGQLEEGQKTTRLLSNGGLVVDGLVYVAPCNTLVPKESPTHNKVLYLPLVKLFCDFFVNL
jgi:hypothetical protein